MKRVLKIFTIMLVLLVFTTGCGKKEDLLEINFDTKKNEAKLKYDTENPVVAMRIKRYGAIVMELYPDKAENTVNNFIYLVKEGFYDGNNFHRLVRGFVLQGGDPRGDGTAGPGYFIKGEFSKNGYTKNDLKHEEKIVSMARGQDYDTAGSQFFIMLGDVNYLDGEYAAFGKVIDGWDVIEKIEKNEILEDKESGKLQRNITISKALVDTKGKEYKDVEKIPIKVNKNKSKKSKTKE